MAIPLVINSRVSVRLLNNLNTLVLWKNVLYWMFSFTIAYEYKKKTTKASDFDAYSLVVISYEWIQPVTNIVWLSLLN